MPSSLVTSPPTAISSLRKQPYTKLLLTIVAIVGVTVYVAYLSAGTSWKYYVTADECVTQLAELNGSRVRVSGTVAAESLRVNGERSKATFELQGKMERLDAVCTCTLPDNLQEGMEVVVEGYLQANGTLNGDKILTKCASKYDEGRETDANAASANADGNL